MWGRRELSLPLSGTIRSRAKRGALEHHDSWALTGSPALTPWPCPRHRDLAYQRWLSSLEGRDLRTQSTKESAGKKGRLARA